MGAEIRKLAFGTAAFCLLASLFTSILVLAQPIYLMQILINVLPGKNIDTLIALSLIVGVAFIAYGIVDYLRGRILFRSASQFEAIATHRIISEHLENPSGVSLRIPLLRDVTTIRNVVGTRLMGRLFELPFVPLFVFLMFVNSRLLGAIFVLGLIVYVSLAFLFSISRPTEEGPRLQAAMSKALEEEIGNQDLARGHSAHGTFARRYMRNSKDALLEASRLRSGQDAYGSATSVLRLLLQAAVLGVGAYLAIHGEIEPGVVIALGWIAGRAFAPMDALVGGLEQIRSALRSYKSLKAAFSEPSDFSRLVSLPRPTGEVRVEGVSHMPPTALRPVLNKVAFDVPAGSALGIIGPSGAGKSTLLQIMMGLVQPTRGIVRIDGHDLRHWSRGELESHIGYVPQPVRFLNATVGQTIARQNPDADPAMVIAAAKAAGIHEIIQYYPKGYNTPIGPSGVPLPGGHNQFIALARALYGNPSVVFLDEPNANLDQEGDDRLFAIMRSLKEQGTTMVFVTQRPNLLQFADQVLVLKEGRMDALSTPAELRARSVRPAPANPERPPDQQSLQRQG